MADGKAGHLAVWVAAAAVGLPATGLALRYGHRWLNPVEQAGGPLLEITGPDRVSLPRSGLDHIRPEPAPAAAPAPSRSSLDYVAREPLPEEPGASRKPATAPGEPLPEFYGKQRPAYPKLRTTRGFRSWFQPTSPSRSAFYPNSAAPALEKPEAGPAARAQAQSASAEPAKPAPAAAAAKPERKGYRPPPPVYGGATGGTLAQTAGPAGEARVSAGPRGGTGSSPSQGWPEHTTFIGPPDRLPQPNPEKPNARDGTCPKRGWWRAGYNGLCYQTRASCLAADYSHEGCEQPNP